jgi:hypothetical protein
MGSHVLLTGLTLEHRLRIVAPSDRMASPGEVMHFRPLPGRIRWMDAATGAAIGEAA